MSELCWEVPGALPRVSGAARNRLPNTTGEEPPLERKLILCIRKSLVKGLLLLQPLLYFNSLFSFSLMGINAAIPSSPAEVPVLLQPLHEPHAEPALRAQALRSGEAEDGGDAAAQHVVDRGAVPEESSRRPLPVSCHTHVHLRLCLLPQKE